MILSNNERIIENVNATMNMEGMPLTSEDKELARKCLEGEQKFEEAIKILIKQYSQKPQ